MRAFAASPLKRDAASRAGHTTALSRLNQKRGVLYVCGWRVRGLKRRRVGSRVRARPDARRRGGGGSRRSARVGRDVEGEVGARGSLPRRVDETAETRSAEQWRAPLRTRALAARVLAFRARHAALAADRERAAAEQRAEQRDRHQPRCETSRHLRPRDYSPRTYSASPMLPATRTSPSASARRWR